MIRLGILAIMVVAFIWAIDGLSRDIKTKKTQNQKELRNLNWTSSLANWLRLKTCKPMTNTPELKTLKHGLSVSTFPASCQKNVEQDW